MARRHAWEQAQADDLCRKLVNSAEAIVLENGGEKLSEGTFALTDVRLEAALGSAP